MNNFWPGPFPASRHVNHDQHRSLLLLLLLLSLLLPLLLLLRLLWLQLLLLLLLLLLPPLLRSRFLDVLLEGAVFLQLSWNRAHLKKQRMCCLAELGDNELDRVIAVNLATPARLCREAARRWQNHASRKSIVNISSVAARTGSPNEYVV